MMKIVILTDLHLTTGGAKIIGLDPLQHFEAALDDALAHHGNADLLMLTGDLAHKADPAAYAALSQRLKSVELPLSLIPGNHDRRQPMSAIFPEHVADDGFFHRIIDHGDTRLILLDTLDEAAPDLHSGLMCADRLTWLRSALNTPKRKIIFSHHPLAETGFEGMDAIRLRNARDVADLLTEAKAEIIISGHIHRTISGVWHGLPYAVVKSTCHQMPLVLGPAGSDISSDDPAGYGVVLIGDAGVTIHTADTGSGAEITSDPTSVTPD